MDEPSTMPAPFAEEEGMAHPAQSRLGFPVVGIGASAGGLAALRTLFEHTPPDAGMAYVVILHLSPTHESHVDQILQRVTTMPVLQVTQTIAIERDHVYVIPPTKVLSMDDGHLRLTDLARPRGRHVAIDLFLRTLARAHRERAIGVVLSGTGSDGAVGVRTLKEEGGVTIAQSPRDAEYDAMPLAAIATGVVDRVLRAEEIGPNLVAMWQNARQIVLPDAGNIGLQAREPEPVEAPSAEESLREIMVLLHQRTGHDFRHYKRATVLRRIERRLQVNNLPDLPSYSQLLKERVDETGPLLQDMLISVTNFFRDPEAFDALKRELQMHFFEARTPPTQMRAWVAGCATGEEAYSVAMLLSELEPAASQPLVAQQVFASDIDERAIAVGRVGVFPESIVTDVSAARLRRFFVREGEAYRIKKPVREKILFAVHNVLRDPPFSRLDLICCRNLLIYLDRDIQASVLEMFHFALQPGGLLFLGSSETTAAAPTLFTAVDKRHRVYRANAVARPAPLRLPTLLRPQGSLPITLMASPAPPRSPYEQLHRRLIEQYAPPSMLIDADDTIVHMAERAARYLRHVGGAPSYNLLAVIEPTLRLALRTALFNARQSGQSVKARRVRLDRDGKPYSLNMSVRPVHDGGDGALGTRLVLVVFDEVEVTLAEPTLPVEDSKDPLVIELEAELQKLNEHLHGSIGESEASAEALRASNEELQAINEELRSATEELETSKEELQSVNEELITVNYELKNKVDETAKVNDDLQNLMAATDIATVFIDVGMHIKRYTPRAAEVFNIIATDVGRSLLDITHRLDYDTLIEDAAEAYRTLRVVERHVRSDQGRWYFVRVLPYRTTEDRIDGAVLTFIDITALRKAEDALRVRDQRLRLVADSTRDYAIVTTDPSGKVTSWNLGAEHTFGYTEAEILHQPLALLFTPEDIACGMPERERRRARDEGRAEDERWHLRKDGSRIYCSGIMTRLADPGLEGYAKIARDLTDSKRHESERESMLASEKDLRNQLEAAAASKDEFLAVMSHELKNPLNLIQISAELLARTPEARASPQVGRAVEVIRRTVLSQAQIIDDLLDLSRLSTGKMALAREAVSWAAVVERIVEAVRADADAKGVQVGFEHGPDGEGFSVDADPVRLEQIVWNLVSNALKFTPSGGRVSISLTREADGVRLDVADTGRGIEPDFIGHVFEMFRQRDSRTTRRDGGLGIGLALVHDLAQLHGGRAWAHSDGPGHGARFGVWLPAFHGDQVGAARGAAARGVTGLRLLLVDDAPDTLESFAMLLTLEGAHVTTAGSGAQALDCAARQDFDLIVSDVAMPGMDGYQLIAALRQSERHARTKAVAVTGFGRPVDASNALAAGFDAHLGKPIGVSALIAVANRLLA